MTNVSEEKQAAKGVYAPVVSTRYDRADLLDELAKRRRTKRSRIVAAALDEYLGRNAAELLGAA